VRATRIPDSPFLNCQLPAAPFYATVYPFTSIPPPFATFSPGSFKTVDLFHGSLPFFCDPLGKVFNSPFHYDAQPKEYLGRTGGLFFPPACACSRKESGPSKQTQFLSLFFLPLLFIESFLSWSSFPPNGPPLFRISNALAFFPHHVFFLPGGIRYVPPPLCPLRALGFFTVAAPPSPRKDKRLFDNSSPSVSGLQPLCVPPGELLCVRSVLG